MRGFIKPRFTRLHMPFRAKAERSRHSFHLQAVGLALALLAGVLCGSFWQHAGHNTGSFSAAMSVSFLSAMILQAVVLFFSLSCIGAPVLACVPVLRGISIGCVSAYLYASMGMRGLLANLILFWLPAILQSVFLVLFTDAALDTSTSLFRLNFLEQATGAGTKISRCLRIFVVSSLGMLLAAILEGLLAVIFAPVFLK
mgnify:CR=1 FL=1